MKISTRNLSIAAVTAAAYASVTILLAPISYGALQFRLSEVLCVLPFFVPASSLGLFVGCAIANFMSAAGPIDVVFGSLATLLAALCTARFGRVFRENGEMPSMGASVLGVMMPVIFNGPIIGAVLAYAFAPPEAFWQSLVLFGSQVAIGEAGVMLLLGLPVLRLAPRIKSLREFCGNTN